MPMGVLALAAVEAGNRSGPYYLVAGVVGLCAGSVLLSGLFSRLAGDSAEAEDEPAGLRAVGHFLPIAAASLVAMLLGSTDVAVGIVFGTSVGALTTVVGIAALAQPVEGGPRKWTRLWPFALVASLIVFIAGFKGTFQWHDAVALLTEGVVIVGLWLELGERPRVASSGDVYGEVLSGSSTLNYETPKPRGPWRIDWGRAALALGELVLIGALLWVSSLAATRGAVRTGGASSRGAGVSASALAGSVISLALVLPMTWGSWRRAERGRSWSPVSTQVGVVLLNLCALLPLLIVLPYAAARLPQLSRWAGDALAYGEGTPRLLLFPAPMWRIDNVVLLIVGALLLPVSLRRWNLGREEGMVLIAGYFFYLTATLLSG
jgi:Ca2+/Na+ antiporter